MTWKVTWCDQSHMFLLFFFGGVHCLATFKATVIDKPIDKTLRLTGPKKKGLIFQNHPNLEFHLSLSFV